VDLSERSGGIIDWSAWLAREYQATLGIVHATARVDLAAAENLESTNLEKQFQSFVSEEARKEIDMLQAQSDTESILLINSGDPVEVIARASRDFDTDLLVIGRHGDRELSGSPRQKRSGHHTVNAYAIMRESPCPVISI
jgi:nucleotide-binding universal stress UspA family protein